MSQYLMEHTMGGDQGWKYSLINLREFMEEVKVRVRVTHQKERSKGSKWGAEDGWAQVGKHQVTARDIHQELVTAQEIST